MVTRVYKKTHQNNKLFRSKKRTPLHRKTSLLFILNATVQTKALCPCDGGCPRCRAIQPKLTIGKPNDKYEQEADRVADQVMKMPDPDNVQRKAGCSSCIDAKEWDYPMGLSPHKPNIIVRFLWLGNYIRVNPDLASRLFLTEDK